jgi:hypothetical protein
MYKALVASAFLAPAAAPQPTLAASHGTLPGATPLAWTHSEPGFEVVDPSTGRPVATLIPIAGSPGTFLARPTKVAFHALFITHTYRREVLHHTSWENRMKLPISVAAASVAVALAACSGQQNGATTAVPGVVAPQSAPLNGAATMSNVRRNRFVAARSKAGPPLILVLNEGGGTGGTIGEFPETANGNVAPSSVISSAVGQPFAIAFTSTGKGRIGIADGNLDNSGLDGVETFALSSGNFLKGISCFRKPSTTRAVAFDSRGSLYVSDTSGDISTVDVFASGANGCEKPQRTISDEGGLAIDSNNVLYVANSTTNTIDIFAAGSSTMEAQIGGSNSGLEAPSTVAVDASRNVYVVDSKTATISEFAAGATGNVAPIRTIAGSKTGLSGGALAVSKASGEIFVVAGTNAIFGFAATASGNVAPIQTIAGSATQLSVPLGIALTE